MAEPRNNDEAPDAALPEAVVQSRSRFSLVWLIPLVAAAIGAWLAYTAYSEQGPAITITFKTAEGLEAGKTKIRYKDVEVGEVEEIALSEDLSRVIVTARLVKHAERYLTRKTRFWVVRARVSAGQVSGLGTLLAGAYIGVDPVPGGAPVYSFTGLEIPPVVTTDDPGRHYMLHADELGSLQIGSPVYFREIKVGEVVAYELDESGRSVDVQVFVRAPHHERVDTNTRFWNASGLDVSIGANGIEVETQSLTSLMLGGVGFENPSDGAPGRPALEGEVFRLYANRKSAFEQKFVRRTRWLLHFTGSVRGLEAGAPVEFRGIKLGEVIDISLELDVDKTGVRIPVIIELEPERMKMIGDVPDETNADFEQVRRQLMDRLVANGLRAQLKTGSLITGALFVDLDVYQQAQPRRIVWEGDYPELPTVPTPIEELKNVLTNALQKFEQLPLEQMGDDFQKSLAALSKTAVQLEQLALQVNTKVAPTLTGTLVQTRKTLGTAQQTLATMEKTIAPNSALQQELQAVLRELRTAARSIRIMADYLERHPEALLRGKTGDRR